MYITSKAKPRKKNVWSSEERTIFVLLRAGHSHLKNNGSNRPDLNQGSLQLWPQLLIKGLNHYCETEAMNLFLPLHLVFFSRWSKAWLFSVLPQ